MFRRTFCKFWSIFVYSSIIPSFFQKIFIFQITFTHLGEVSNHEFKMGHHQSCLFANLPSNYYLNQSLNKNLKKKKLPFLQIAHTNQEPSSGSVIFSCYPTLFQISQLPLFLTSSKALVMITYAQEGGTYEKTSVTLRLIMSGKDIYCSPYLPLQSSQHGWNRIQWEELIVFP